jgi:hypothetical protein
MAEKKARAQAAACSREARSRRRSPIAPKTQVQHTQVHLTTLSHLSTHSGATALDLPSGRTNGSGSHAGVRRATIIARRCRQLVGHVGVSTAEAMVCSVWCVSEGEGADPRSVRSSGREGAGERGCVQSDEHRQEMQAGIVWWPCGS